MIRNCFQFTFKICPWNFGCCKASLNYPCLIPLLAAYSQLLQANITIWVFPALASFPGYQNLAHHVPETAPLVHNWGSDFEVRQSVQTFSFLIMCPRKSLIILTCLCSLWPLWGQPNTSVRLCNFKFQKERDLVHNAILPWRILSLHFKFMDAKRSTGRHTLYSLRTRAIDNQK